MKYFKEFELPSEPVIPNNTVSIADFGAVGDGKTLNTAAIHLIQLQYVLL